MNVLPDLDRLSYADEKDELIRALLAHVQALTKQAEPLTTKVAELEGRLAQNSWHSSRPSSADGMNRPKAKSPRPAGQKPSGGQQGHPGHTLKQTAQPEQIELHGPADHCEACGRPLAAGGVIETRQVFDIPPWRHEVTEHRVTDAVCQCGKVPRGIFPDEAVAPVP